MDHGRIGSRILRGFVASVLLLVAGSSLASVIAVSDSSWKITGLGTGFPPSGTSWYSSAAFNDSNWQQATAFLSVGTVIPGNVSQEIWTAEGTYGHQDTQAWARSSFNVAGPLTSALMTVGCDDDCTVWVNGVMVVNDTNGYANNSTANLLPYLINGSNLIAVHASDNYLKYGYQHGFWMELDGNYVPRPTSVPEPATLGVLAIGCLGVALSRRRGTR